MKIINKIGTVIEKGRDAFMKGLLDGTGLVVIDCYDRNGKLVSRSLTHESNVVLTKTYPV